MVHTLYSDTPLTDDQMVEIMHTLKAYKTIKETKKRKPNYTYIYNFMVKED